MAENTSYFNKGLDLDSDPLSIDKDSLSYGEHLLVSSREGNKLLLTSELGNELGFTPLNPYGQTFDGYILGYKTISNYIILAISSITTYGDSERRLSILAQIDVQANTYTNLFVTENPHDYLNFTADEVKYVDIELRFDYKNELICYITDNFNTPKSINLYETTNKDLNNVCTITDQITFNNIYNLFNANTPLAYISNPEVKDGGNLITTVFNFGIRHKVSTSIYTSVGSISQSIPISDKLESSPSNLYNGNIPDTVASKSISFTINGLDTTYKYFDLIVIYYKGLASQRVIGVVENIPITATTMNYTFSSLDTITKEISLNELVQTFANYSSARSIIQKDNTLLLAGLKKTYDNTDWQAIANSITIKGKYHLEEIIDQSNVTTGGTSGVEEISDKGNYDSTKYLYKDPIDTFDKKTWCPEEVESFAFYPIFADGSPGFAYHIQAPDFGTYTDGAKNYPSLNYSTYTELGTFVSSEIFSGTEKLRFHLFPKFEDTQFVKTYDTTSLGIQQQEITLIKLEFEVTGAGATLLNDAINRKIITGWKIVRQPKNKVLNKRVVTTGIAPTATYSYNNSVLTESPVFIPLRHQDFLGSSGNTKYFGYKNGLLNEYPIFISPDVIENNIITEAFNKFKIGGYYTLYNNINPSNSDYAFTKFDPSGTGLKTGVGLFLNSKVINNSTVTNLIDIPSKQKIVYLNDQTINTNNVAIRHRLFDAYLIIPDSLASYSGVDTLNPPDYGLSVDQEEDQDIEGVAIDTSKIKIPFCIVYNDINNYFGRYNDFTYIDVETNYLISGNNLKLTDVFNGDKFWCKYAIRNNTSITEDIGGNKAVSHRALFYGWFLCEGNYNYKSFENPDFTNLTPGTMPYYPYEKMLINDSDTYGILSFASSLGYGTGYNKQYQIGNNALTYFVKNNTFTQITNFPNRHIYSQTNIEGDLNDYYRIFLENDYYDLPKNKGEIVNMFIRRSILYTRTTLGLWRNYYNALNSQASSLGEVFAGTGKAFSIPSTPLTEDNTAGIQHFNASVETPYGEVWFDSASKTLWIFDEQLQSLNNNLDIYFKKTITGTNIDYLKYGSFEDNPYKGNVGVVLNYDQFFNRLLLKFCGLDITLSFSLEKEYMNWVSFHKYTYDFMLNHNKLLLSSKNNNFRIFKWYTPDSSHLIFNDEESKDCVVEYVINNGFYAAGDRTFQTDSKDTKVFDNFVIKTRLEQETFFNNYKTFDELTVSNSKYSRTVSIIQNNSDYNYESFEDESLNIRGTKYINEEYRMTIPNNGNSEPTRFKDKYLKIRFKLNAPKIIDPVNLRNSAKFVLYYITTIFRINKR